MIIDQEIQDGADYVINHDGFRSALQAPIDTEPDETATAIRVLRNKQISFAGWNLYPYEFVFRVSVYDSILGNLLKVTDKISHLKQSPNCYGIAIRDDNKYICFVVKPTLYESPSYQDLATKNGIRALERFFKRNQQPYFTSVMAKFMYRLKKTSPDVAGPNAKYSKILVYEAEYVRYSTIENAILWARASSSGV